MGNKPQMMGEKREGIMWRHLLVSRRMSDECEENEVDVGDMGEGAREMTKNLLEI